MGAGGQFQPAVGASLETEQLRSIHEEHRCLHFFVAPTGNRTVDIDHGITRIQRIHGFESLALGGMDKGTRGGGNPHAEAGTSRKHPQASCQ